MSCGTHSRPGGPASCRVSDESEGNFSQLEVLVRGHEFDRSDDVLAGDVKALFALLEVDLEYVNGHDE